MFFRNHLFTGEQFTVYPGKYRQRACYSQSQMWSSQPITLFSFSLPSSWNQAIPRQMIGRRRNNVPLYLAYFSSQCVNTTTTNSH